MSRVQRVLAYNIVYLRLGMASRVHGFRVVGSGVCGGPK